MSFIFTYKESFFNQHMSFFQLPEQTLELILPIQAKQMTNRKFIKKRITYIDE